VPQHSSAVLCVQHLDGNRRGLLAQVSGRDLEGIVAKWRAAPYRLDVAPLSGIKIKNPEYSQA
jgi:ATP-dependent DNA ligase